jgi:hypothetical protein
LIKVFKAKQAEGGLLMVQATHTAVTKLKDELGANGQFIRLSMGIG